MSDIFELICRHKDTNPNNLNAVFESYGVNTLEAKVPVVNDTVAEKLRSADHEKQKFAALALKSESAAMAIDGRFSRLRNRQVSLVGIGKDTMIAAGKEREKTPVDRDELDDDLEQYMRVAAKKKAEREGRDKMVVDPKPSQRPLFATINQKVDENMSLDNLFDNMKASK